MSWRPWRVLGRQHPGIWTATADLPEPGARYYPAHDVVLLDRRLDERGRRCAISHELVHIQRGDTACGGWHGRRQERLVERESARRLITLDDLISALQWSQDERELADELWVDVTTLRARLASLTADEHVELVMRVYSEEPGP